MRWRTVFAGHQPAAAVPPLCAAVDQARTTRSRTSPFPSIGSGIGQLAILLALLITSLPTRGAAPLLPALQLETPGVNPGEVLLGELNCLACHPANPAIRARLPARPAPRLGTLGQRVRPAWIARYLQAPHREKPGTLMPDLIAGVPGTEQSDAVAALAAFLLSLTPPGTNSDVEPTRLAIEQGRVLYHRTGCVACHAPREPAASIFPEIESGPTDADATRFVLTQLEQTSVPLGDLRAKYRPGGLISFLLDPLAIRPAGRMPSLRLTEPEARAIATYLQRDTATNHAAPPPASEPAAGRLVRRGREAFASLGCAACHELGPGHPAITSTLRAPPFDQLNPDAPAGCLSTDPGPQVPRFEFAESQRRALREVLTRPAESAKPAPAATVVLMSMAALNCRACHARDGYGGPTPSRSDYFVVTTGTDLGDEGRIPPHLSQVGNKLRPDWLREVLLGQGRVRPYMATRMPQFAPAIMEVLVTNLVKADVPVDAPPLSGPPARDPETGHRLVGTNGYACVSCHTFGPYRSLGISVMDMTQLARRLRHDWFRRYLLDPPSLRPGTRMPAFWPDGKPTLPDVLDGDAARQIDAIWSYLSLGPAAPTPAGLDEAQITPPSPP